MRNSPLKPPPKAARASPRALPLLKRMMAVPSGVGPSTVNWPSHRPNKLQRSAEGATSFNMRGHPCCAWEIALMSSSVRPAADWDSRGDGMAAAADCKQTHIGAGSQVRIRSKQAASWPRRCTSPSGCMLRGDNPPAATGQHITSHICKSATMHRSSHLLLEFCAMQQVAVHTCPTFVFNACEMHASLSMPLVICMLFQGHNTRAYIAQHLMREG